MLIMKKLFNIFALIAAAVLLLGSCAKQEVDTNQFPATADVVLKAYGPRPVVRGGVLRFVGANLDQVSAVEIPGVGDITDIEVITKGVPSEIRITLPKDGPEPGYPVLKTKGGKTIQPDTPLSYTENIVLDSVSPEAAYPGEKVTLKGDYLNLIHEVVFTKDVVISEKDFVSQNRYSIVVVVPEGARTGKIGIGTIDESVVTDESLLAALNVIEADFTVKTAEGSVSGTFKAGSTVTVNGSHLDLVKGVKVGMTEIDSFNATASRLTFVLPAEVGDDEIILVMASGVEVSAGDLVTVKPSNLSASPAPVKNGSVLTIAGKDLDLVSGVEFPHGGWAEFTNDGKITVTVPEAAQSGDIILHMLSGESVTVPYSLVEPKVTGFSANPAAAGSDVTIEGTDLDLVKSIIFSGSVPVDVEASETAITVAVPTAAETGVLTFILKNDLFVETVELAVDKPAGAYIAVFPEDLYSPGDMFIIEIENDDHLTGVQVDGQDVNYILNAGTLYMQIPADASVDSQLTLVSDNGSVTYTMNIDPGDFIVTPIWTGSFVCDNWNGEQGLAWGGFDWSTVTPGTLLRFEMEPNVPLGSWWCISLRHGTSWGALAGVPGQYDNPGEFLDVELTQEILDDLLANSGLVITGTGFVLKSVSLVEDLRYGETIWTGSFTCDDWNGEQGLAWGGYDWSTVSPGKTLFFHMTPTVDEGAWWCISLRHGTSWGALAGVPGQYDTPESPMGVVLTQEILNDLVANSGLVVTGTGFILEKVSLK